MDGSVQAELIAYLEEFVTPERQRRIDEVLAWRTNYLTVVIEDIFQPHNASAVIRSCDLFGVQQMHIIENRYRYRVNPKVALGASKWVTLHRYNVAGQDNSSRALTTLRAAGYRIVATTLRPGSQPIQSLPLDRPLALCFGTEEQGLSDRAHELADLYTHIPMVGFTQSFNISVSAALCLYELTGRLHVSDHPWRLDEATRQKLRLTWLTRSAASGEQLVARFLKEQG